MIGGLIDSLMGKVDYRAQAPRIDTRPGQQAIQTQARQGGQQALAQSYALANSGRGGGASTALALREAQRRGAEATANLNTQALSQQQALQQSVNQQQAQAEMQAQQINAGIAQQEAGGVQRLAGAALMAGALMSDRSQKEMYSDFATKEDVPVGSYIPQQVRPGVDPAALSNLEVNRFLRDRGEMLDMQALQDPNEQAIARQNMADLEQRRAEAAKLMAERNAGRKQSGLLTLGSNLMTSDKRAKQVAFQEGLRAGMQRSPMAPGYTHVPPPGYGGAMTSDFQQKEELDPVRPTLYRYKPESSYRQALEAAQRTFATTYEDKRAPREGIVAQDLQRSPAFAPSVVEKDDGQLAIDRDRALSAALFELGGLHRRVKTLEGARAA